MALNNFKPVELSIPLASITQLRSPNQTPPLIGHTEVCLCYNKIFQGSKLRTNNLASKACDSI